MAAININNYTEHDRITKDDAVDFYTPEGNAVHYFAKSTERSGYNNTYWMCAPMLNNSHIFEAWDIDKIKMARSVFKEHAGISR